MPEITYSDGLLKLTVDPAHSRMVSDWPGWRRMGASGTHHARPWASSILAVGPTAAFKPTWSKEASKVKETVLAALARAREAAGGGVLPMVVGGGWPTERTALPHQVSGMLAARDMGFRCLLSDDMGLGKTSTALWCAHEANAKRILILCPVSAKFNWAREIELTLGKNCYSIVVDGGQKARATQLSGLPGNMTGNVDPVACIINYDLLRVLDPVQIQKLQAFVQGGFLICDESHYLKSKSADRTEITQKIAEHCSQVMLLSGTPVRNTVEDLYTQVEICRPGTWTSYYDFCDRYLQIAKIDFGKRPVRKVVGSKNIDKLNAVLNTLQIRRKKENVINLPPKMRTFPELQLDGPTAHVYKAMKEWATIELSKLCEQPDGQQATIFDPRAQSAVEAAMRCEQIAQGFLGGIPEPLLQRITPLLKHAERIPGRPQELIFPKANKIQWMIETIENLLSQGNKVTVFSKYNAPLFWFAKHFTDAGVGVDVLHGGVSAEKRDEAIGVFQAPASKPRILFAQVSICEAFNLSACQDAIFYGRSWSPAANLQAEDRLHRLGQRGTVNIQVPVVRDTIEVAIDKRLRAKENEAEDALRTMTVVELMESL